MGLFRRLAGKAYNTTASVVQPTERQPDGTGVQPGGDVGGDIQRGGSYSVRFVRPDKPGSLITVTFYAVEYGCPSGFVVQRQIEWLVCEDPSDPGGTENWSEVVHDDPFSTAFDTVGAAEEDAWLAAQEALGVAWAYGRWDGEPDWSNGSAVG